MSCKGNKSSKWGWMLNRLFIAKFFIREWYITNSLSELFCFDIHINYSAIWSTALKISSLRQMNHILYFIKTQHLKIFYTTFIILQISNFHFQLGVWFWEKCSIYKLFWIYFRRILHYMALYGTWFNKLTIYNIYTSCIFICV